MKSVSTSFVLRAATPSDAAALTALMASIYEEDRWFVGDGPPEPGYLERRIRALNPSRELLLVAVPAPNGGSEREDLLGWIDARKLAYRRVEHVANLTIAVAAAARRQGVGRALLRAVEPWARRVGVVKLRLDVRASNQPAISLYESHGFEREGVERALIRGEHGYDDNLIFGKFLTPVR